MRFLIYFTSALFSWIGWSLGDYLLGDMFFSFCLSTVFAVLGIYVGWRIGQSIE